MGIVDARSPAFPLDQDCGTVRCQLAP
jgi:hypothetical protein